MSILINNESPLFYDELKKKCKENGISLSELCRMADISRDSLANWKNQNPGTIKTLFAIEKIFSNLKDIEPGENGFFCMAEKSCKIQCQYCQDKSSK